MIQFLHYDMCTLHIIQNAIMADFLVGTRHESLESEGSVALMSCFDNASPGKPRFVVDLVCLFSPSLCILCSWMSPEGSEIFYVDLYMYI